MVPEKSSTGLQLRYAGNEKVYEQRDFKPFFNDFKKW